MNDTAVKAMFETIAPGYDFQNSILSLRRDIYWRRVLAEILQLDNGGVVLDVAVGTAETALAIGRRYPGCGWWESISLRRCLVWATKKLPPEISGPR